MHGPVVVALAGGGKAPLRALLAVRAPTPSGLRRRAVDGPACPHLRFPG